MPTAATIIQDVRVMFGDPDGEFITGTLGLDWLNIAQERFTERVLALDEVKDYPLIARVREYDVPGDYIEATRVIFLKDMQGTLKAESPAEFQRIQSGFVTSIGRPVYYTIYRRQLTVGPQAPISNSATALASGNQASTATAIALTAVSGTFRSQGFLYNASTGEVLQYRFASGATVYGITRAVHNTTAASIASGGTWQEVDLQMYYRRLASALTTTTQSPEIPTTFHRYLELYMLYRAWHARGDMSKAQVIYNEFEESEGSAREKVGRRFIEPMSIKDRRGRTYPPGYW